ncbi:MAG: arginase [Pyrinomonadaceae bacterium]
MNNFNGLSNGEKIGLLGIPLGYAAAKPGSDLGVEAMRRFSKLSGNLLIERIRELGYDVHDFGNAEIISPEADSNADGNPKYLEPFLASCQNILESLNEVLESERMPVILGGDHSIAIATFSALSKHARNRREEIGLIWFDAHADINTPETTKSGNLHGMPLAVLLGDGVESLVNLANFRPKLRPEFFAHVGARDLDEGERQRIHELGLRDNFLTMTEIDRRGIFDCVQQAIRIASRAPGGYAVTFDVDFIDPVFAPGSGTLVRGGASYREAHLALETIAEAGGLRSFEIVEVNPQLDQSNITVELACELILSALGKTII